MMKDRVFRTAGHSDKLHENVQKTGFENAF